MVVLEPGQQFAALNAVALYQHGHTALFEWASQAIRHLTELSVAGEEHECTTIALIDVMQQRVQCRLIECLLVGFGQRWADDQLGLLLKVKR